MGARDLLSELAGAGITVVADGGRLVLRPASRLTDPLRERLKAAKPELLTLLSAPIARPVIPSASPLAAWTGDEIAAYEARLARLIRWGWAADAAQRMAERLTRRDREGDARRACVECSNLSDRGRCLAASAGRLAGTDRRHEPVQTILQHCEAFGLRKELK